MDGEDGADGEDGKDGSDGKNGSDAEALFIDESSYNAETNTLTDLRDGKTYKTTTIGEQVWMAENLNYLYYFKAKEDSIVVPDYCYNDTASYCDKYGRLYQWSAAMDSAAVFSDGGKGCGQFADCESKAPVRGVCPKGWHLPSVEEFVKLLDAVGGDLIAGDTLKSTSGWETVGYGEIANGTDDYGFTALPGGFRETGSEYATLGEQANFWTSSLGEQDGYLVIEIVFWAGSNDVIQAHSYKWRSNSVRCLMD
ncbi:MAG: fibrobacter succinogenes major paralogous domain-containing protein [Fibrobacter sp.]|nr:fibrobacter succinogenes major paralogous domain-containing protein [Fibrobacter sp.]